MLLMSTSAGVSADLPVCPSGDLWHCVPPSSDSALRSQLYIHQVGLHGVELGTFSHIEWIKMEDNAKAVTSDEDTQLNLNLFLLYLSWKLRKDI